METGTKCEGGTNGRNPGVASEHPNKSGTFFRLDHPLSACIFFFFSFHAPSHDPDGHPLEFNPFSPHNALLIASLRFRHVHSWNGTGDDPQPAQMASHTHASPE